MLSDAQNYRAQQDAAAYGAQSQDGWAGGLGAILSGINGFRSAKRGEQAAEMEAQAQQAIYDRDQEQARLQAEQEKIASAAAREQELQDLAAKRTHELKLANTKATAGHENAMALQDDRQAFELQQTTDKRAYAEANKTPDYKQGDSLRKEFQNLQPVKDFDEVNASMQKVVNSSKNPNPATDIALITGFMKMNDPGSTVREGEFATAASAGSANEKFVNLYNGLVNGQRLTDEQRSYFVNSAGRLYQAHADLYGSLRGQYDALAQRQGLDPESIFIKRSRVEMEQPSQATDLSKMSLEELQALRSQSSQ